MKDTPRVFSGADPFGESKGKCEKKSTEEQEASTGGGGIACRMGHLEKKKKKMRGD